MAKKGDSVKKITDVNEITPEIQEFVDEAARERAASMERRKEYIQRREMERAELSQAEAERKAEEAAKFFDETLKPR
jgi:predicted transcriptional regulator